jgi:hypothetical protein
VSVAGNYILIDKNGVQLESHNVEFDEGVVVVGDGKGKKMKATLWFNETQGSLGHDPELFGAPFCGTKRVAAHVQDTATGFEPQNRATNE